MFLESPHYTFVTDLVVAINIHFPQKLVYLVIFEFFSQVHENMTELLGVYEAISVFVEDSEGVQQTVSALHRGRLGLNYLLQLVQ